MDGEEIGLVLARASELRSKVSSCILDRERKRSSGGGPGGGEASGVAGSGGEGEGGEEEKDEEEERLVGVRDALASLEQQLASLQALQQQQLYERESTIAQIDRSRMILLCKLKEYEGEELEVIHEAAAFAGETLERDDDLLLPPYPRHLPEALVLDDLYSSNFICKHKQHQNGLSSGSFRRPNNSADGSDKKQTENTSGSGWGGLRAVVGFIAKSVLTALGIASILSLAGVDPKLSKYSGQLNLSALFQNTMGEEKHRAFQCPPGKVLVMENGEPRCVVKERIEIPFEADVRAPNLSYGFG